MKLHTGLLLLMSLVAIPHRSYGPGAFRYQRQIDLAPVDKNAQPADACVVLDPEVFAHSAPSLDDIRVFTAGAQETPYAVTMSQTSATAEAARVLNLGLKSPRHISFDLQMPDRPYSSVDLKLSAKNFLGSARFTGLKSLADKAPVYLGEYSIFDLTSQRLGRSSQLDFSESTFPYLHLELSLAPAPASEAFAARADMVTGAEVPASRVAQTLYTPVAATSVLTLQPGRTIATFTIPAHVPVERVSFELDPSYSVNFDRPVTITAQAVSPTTRDNLNPQEQLSGQISRVRLLQSGQQIREQSLSIPAILGANAKAPATIQVAVENGDDQPVRLRSVRLEMRQRQLCYPTPGDASAKLLYGGEGVEAPVYDFGRLFNPSQRIPQATLGPEVLNPAYSSQAVKKPFLEVHPALLWVALVGVIAVLGMIAFRSAKRL